MHAVRARPLKSQIATLKARLDRMFTFVAHGTLLTGTTCIRGYGFTGRSGRASATKAEGRSRKDDLADDVRLMDERGTWKDDLERQG